MAERGPTSATLLEHELPVTRQAIVKHLVVLSRAGLVTGQRTGQEVRYALVPGPLDEVSDWIGEIGSRWDERLARLARSCSIRIPGRPQPRCSAAHRSAQLTVCLVART